MKVPGGIEAFTVTALEFLGGAAEGRAPGLYTVLWPTSGSEDLELRQLAFDPEVVDDAPEAELVSFASPILEELVQRVAASGRVTRAFLNAVASASRDAAERLARSYHFVDSAWTAGSGRPWWLPAGVFLFRARYVSDVREEDLLEVAVNLTDGRILRRLAEALDRHGLVAEPVEAWPMMAEWPVRDAYAVARREIEQKLLAPLGLRRRALESRLAQESERAQAYYTELIRELEEPRATLPADSPERPPIEAKLGAIRLEREARLAELRGKYRLEAEVSLRSLLRLYLPKVVFGGKLASKRGESALTLTWDPVAQTGEPVRCPRCQAFTYELGLPRAGIVACPRCVDSIARTPARP